jgi:heme oxygenase
MASLRSETRAAHERIEKISALARLFAPDFSLAEYRRLLGQLYGFYAGLEVPLFDNLDLADQAVLGHRRKLPWLERDLHTLGLAADEVARIAICAQVPATQTTGQRLGVFYVLEGSTLGGQVICRHLLAHFGSEIEPATHFYRGYGERTAQEWRAFHAHMEQRCAGDTEDGDVIIESANETFTSLSNWLEAG